MSIEEDETKEDALRNRLAVVMRRVAAAAHRAGRSAEEITVVGVSKTVERQTIDAAYSAGLRHFGENRVQEAAAKFATPFAGALHLVGHLQSNKARPAAELFDVIESIDRPSVIEALDQAAQRRDRALSVLVQVNVASEPQKSGCAPDRVVELAERAQASGHLRLHGLMTIAPLVAEPEEIRNVFRQLRQLRDSVERQLPAVSLPHLSMGMSNDFEIAIEEGATLVRIGRAIFGER